jgi:RNA polymerase sigma factor (sigma-70 family)
MSQGDAVHSVSSLVRRLRSGESTPTLRRYADDLMDRTKVVAQSACRSWATRLPPSRIDELVQDTLEVVWKKLPEFQDDGPPFESWVRGIAQNLCRNAVRKARELLTDDGVLDPTDVEAHGTLRRMQREERHALVAAAIQEGLQGIEREVLYHRYCDGLRRGRIAEILGLRGVDEVRAILSRAQRRLRVEILERLAQHQRGISMLVTQSE